MHVTNIMSENTPSIVWKHQEGTFGKILGSFSVVTSFMMLISMAKYEAGNHFWGKGST